MEDVRGCKVLFVLAGCFVIASCGRETESDPISQVRSAATAATETTQGSRAPVMPDAALRAAAGCDDCTVLNRATVTLPLTGKTFTHAKLESASRPAGIVVATDGSGKAVDADGLIRAEGRAKTARQGRLRDDAYAASQSSASELVPIAIWADVAVPPRPDRGAWARNPTLKDSHNSQVRANIRPVTSKVTAWLDARGFRSYERGTENPVITADVPGTVLAELGRLDGVAMVEIRQRDVLAGTVNWFNNVRAAQAQAIVASAAGHGFCTGEGSRPDYTDNLPATQVFSSSGSTNWHATWTTELIAGRVKNSNPPQGLRMAPEASPFIANWVNVGSKYTSWNWCFNQQLGGQRVFNMNRSAGTGTGVAEAPRFEDKALDWYVYNYVPLITTSAGNCLSDPNDDSSVTSCANTPANTAVGNRSYNTLVVGASDDVVTDARTDDTIADFSQFTNPLTTHNDFELPHLVAPGTSGTNYVDSIAPMYSTGGRGTSASAPIVLGTALLMQARDTGFDWWPEMIRATLMTASTRPVHGPRTTVISYMTFGDLRQGAGLLDAALAVELANPSYKREAGEPGVARGRSVALYDFSTDFPNGYATAYNITTDRNGRLRVVIAWDASPQACQSDGSDCQGIALDGDLDLRLSKFSGGAWQLVCTSASFDSSWELCDVAVNSAEQYKAEVRLISPISSGTYLGIAWNTYDPASE